MENNYQSLMENLNKNGLLQSFQGEEHTSGEVKTFIAPESAPSNDSGQNIFSTIPFGLSVKPPQHLQKKEIPEDVEFINDRKLIDGLDTDILCNSKFKRIDDKTLKMKIKIARLKAELEEHKKVVESNFLKADKSHYKKLLEIQAKMEEEIKKLVAEYQHQQLISIVVSPFAKVFSYFKNYVAPR